MKINFVDNHVHKKGLNLDKAFNMKFTKEEINLCKQVAEKHKKKIKYGDWFEFKGDILLLKSMHEPEMSDECIPLWTISDCLEFLIEKRFVHLLFSEDLAQCLVRQDRWSKYVADKTGKTLLEACLKAVLAVLEDKQ